jgi:16S rRNA processing protein RimM
MDGSGGAGTKGGGARRALIAVAKMKRPVGLKGEIALEPMTDYRERLLQLANVWIGQDEETARSRRVDRVRMTSSTVILKLGDVGSRTQAEEYRGQYVFVDEEDSPRPEPGSYYVHEVVGLDVVREDGTFIGRIRDVQKFPAQDIWIAVQGDREVMIPAVKEIIRSVELDTRRVIVRLPEGFIDEN